jgi:hypothetical protein
MEEKEIGFSKEYVKDKGVPILVPSARTPEISPIDTEKYPVSRPERKTYKVKISHE